MCRWVCLRLGGRSAPHPALIAPQSPLGLEHVHSVGCDPRKALLHGLLPAPVTLLAALLLSLYQSYQPLSFLRDLHCCWQRP